MNKFNKYRKGFTLIELLIVIGIISLFASIGLVAIFRYREKAEDSRIETAMAQIRSLAAMIYNDSGSYRDMCDTNNTLNENNPNLAIVEIEIKKFNKNSDVKCYASASEYCVQTPLRIAGNYCVDFGGYLGEDQTNCSETNKNCFSATP